jgi:hypothetical protein
MINRYKFLVFLIFITITISETIIAQDIEIDFKTTRISVKVYQGDQRIETGHIVGTITNYNSFNLNDTRLEVKIVSSGVVPVEPEGGGYFVEVFPTKAIYHLGNIESGKTEDFDVSIEITDFEITDIVYEILIKSKNKTGEFEELYRKNETLPVELYSANAISPYHSILIEIPEKCSQETKSTSANLKIKIINNGDFYENNLETYIIVLDNEWEFTTDPINKKRNEIYIEDPRDLPNLESYIIHSTPRKINVSLPPGSEEIINVRFPANGKDIGWLFESTGPGGRDCEYPVWVEIFGSDVHVKNYNNHVLVEVEEIKWEHILLIIGAIVFIIILFALIFR